MKQSSGVKVSVIMPAYNAAEYIRGSVSSVLGQTLPNWELIVVNDGSTDRTLEIIEAFDDGRIQVFSQTNQGEGAARNRALSAAVGEYIAFLDADDLYMPNALTELSSFLDRHLDVDVVYSDGQISDSEGRPLMRISEHRPGPYVGDILEPLILSSSVVLAINSTMTRRSLLETNDIDFDTDLRIGPDWDFWIQVARYGTFGYLNVVTCMYRTHASSVTSATGITNRRQDLVKGRLKIMNAEWFDSLTIETRIAFLRNLLMTLANGQPEQQMAIADAAAFRRIPIQVQGQILRQSATRYIADGTDPDSAAMLLTEACSRNPEDMRTRVLLWLQARWPGLLGLLVGGWRIVQMVRRRIRRDTRYYRKPMPAHMLPSE
jgi:glycosyltransferase involved in cell wall biosynthesis